MTDSRSKGKRVELQMCRALEKVFGVRRGTFRRTAQVDGGLSADIVGPFAGIHIECKSREAIGVMKFLEQALNDREPPDPPMVIMKANRKPMVAMVYLEDLIHVANWVRCMEKWRDLEGVTK